MRKLYIVGTDPDRIGGFTEHKELAKLYKKQRKNAIMVKIKITEDVEKYMKCNEDMELSTYHGVVINNEEFTYFAEAWSQYTIEASMDLEEFLSDITIFKFTDKEKALIRPLIKVLLDYRHDMEHGIVDECEYEDAYYNYHAAIKYFIEHVL